VVAHHFTVDVEEVFHSTLLTERVPEHQWDDQPRRAPEIIPWLLDEMAAAGARGTFFLIGWLAEKEPAMVRQISEAGHEIGAHSWWHRRVSGQDPEAFRRSARRTRELLEQLSGTPVTGFRAPSFSIDPGSEWAFDVLLEEGYRYDSSLFPISIHPTYGYPGGEIDPHWIDREAGALVEVPPLTLGTLGRRLPAAGGAYLRLLPSGLTRRALRQAEKRGASGTLYIHPWDLDLDLPRLRLPPAVGLRLYTGAGKARKRLQRLLAEFPSRPIRETVCRMADLRSES
jgi:polysaccharide deacetylase family protein (PEP-CTERM system associated)